MHVWRAVCQAWGENGWERPVEAWMPSEAYVVARTYNFGGAYTEVLVRAESCLDEVRELYRMMSDPQLLTVGGLLAVERWHWEATCRKGGQL